MTTLPQVPPKALTILKHFVETNSLPNEVSRTEYDGRIARGLRQRRVREFQALCQHDTAATLDSGGVREMVRTSVVFTYTRLTDEAGMVVGVNPPDSNGTSATFALYLTAEGGFLAQGRS